jgi:hypothetical protein
MAVETMVFPTPVEEHPTASLYVSPIGSPRHLGEPS